MKQNISTKTIIAVIALAVVVVVVLAVRTFTAPSATPAAGTEGKAVPPNAGGGPTEEDLRRMREYNAQNPDAPASRQ